MAKPRDSANATRVGDDLAGRRCVPCRGGIQPLTPSEAAKLTVQLDHWKVVEERRIEKHFTFPDFRSALAFVNRIGDIAESEGHHPDIALRWGKVDVTLWTHAAGGLTENDFILAAKIDRLQESV